MNLQNKVIIVTGASSGIGLASARLLAEKGAKIAIVSRSQKELDTIAKDLPGSLALATDLRVESEARQLIKKVYEYYGRIDILINNAGRNYFSSVEQIEPGKMREIFELNIIAPVALIQEAIPIMRAQGGGSIVNISSGTVFTRPLLNMSVYIASKKAIATFSLVGREELKRDNIIVSTVYPYITETDFYKDTLNAGMNTETPRGGGKIPPPDAPGFVAKIILRAIEDGEAEVFAHDWMNAMPRQYSAPYS